MRKLLIALAALALGGCSYGQVTMYKYEYAPPYAPPADLSAAPPGTPPTPPTDVSPTTPQIRYPTMFYRSTFDDPTLVVFVNQGYRVMRLKVGDEPEIVLEPGPSANLHFAPGEYQVRKTVVKPTGLMVNGKPAVIDWVTFFPLRILLNGRSQIIYLYDY